MSEAHHSPEFDDILAECLDDLLRERRTLAECLSAYPEHADELKPALQIGLLTIHLKSPEMPAARVNALEARLMAAATKPIPLQKTSVIPLGLSRLAAALLVGFLLLFGGGAGLVAASADDLPGDTLYGIKRLWESIVLALSPTTGQMDDLWLQLANTRLDEVERLQAEGRLTGDALADLYEASYYLSYYGGDASAIMAYFNKAYLAFTNRIKPPVGAEAVYQDVVQALNPDNRVSNGVIQALPDDLPPSLGGLPPAPTATPTNTFIPPTPTSTATSTGTPTPTETLTPTPTVTLTPSPLFAATATRTPTYTPSPIPTVTATLLPTLTWTPLPLPGGFPNVGSPATQVPPGFIPTEPSVVLPTLGLTERVRATEQSVYLTQTAGPPLVTPTTRP